MYPREKAFGLSIHDSRLLVQEYHKADEKY
ncbi:DNA mismatch repair protein MutT, partial [Bacillus tropicus]|nr:DNA mismatch repair protein MutT [Bacillus tropicus]